MRDKIKSWSGTTGTKLVDDVIPASGNLGDAAETGVVLTTVKLENNPPER